jgi:hypothetical protein
VVPIGIVADWSHRGGTVPLGTAIDLVVSTGPVIEGEVIEGEPVEGEIEGEAIEGEGEFIPLSVEILTPADGRVFNLGDTVAAKIVFNGDPSKAPFRLVFSCAGKADMKDLPTFIVEDGKPGVEYSFLVPPLKNFGPAYFLASVKDKDGLYATDSVSYSVAVPLK